jgi:predicted RNase H-like nuclease (RuvC/YqgF family)
MKQKMLILLTFISITSYSQEITVRKKYLDSIKNQLAIYTTETYTLLNQNERFYNRNQQLEKDVKEMKNLFYYQEQKINRHFRIFGVGYLIALSIFIHGIFKITK